MVVDGARGRGRRWERIKAGETLKRSLKYGNPVADRMAWPGGILFPATGPDTA